MGRLAGLELHNFKLYKGTTAVGLGDACFTSIVGPNGAGKSNMMDAISFVLGIQLLQLRSHNLEDLIYRGRAGADDPALAYVCAVYHKDSGEVMKLRRSINRSGALEYRINERNVTALQYAMALKAENILVKAKNFLVFQGDIEHVAAQLARELAALVETISGAAEHAREYDALRDVHERAHERATEVFSRKRNLNLELKQYREQMREREVFEAKLGEKHTLVKVLHLYRMFHNEKRHFHLLGEVRRVAELLDTTRARLAAEEDAYAALMADYSSSSLAAKKLEGRTAEVLAAAETARRALIPTQASKKSLANRVAVTKKKIADLRGDYASQKAHEDAQRTKLADVERELAAFESKVQALNDSVHIPAAGVREYEKLRSTFLANGGSQLEETRAQLASDKDALLFSMKNYTAQLESTAARIADIESEILMYFQPQLDDANSSLSDLLGNRSSKVLAKDLLMQKSEQANFRELELNAELNTTLTRLDELSSSKNDSKKQKRLRDNVAMLRNHFKDGSIKGLMYELVRSSQQKFDTALQVALGRYMDAIVVESTAVAYKCIEILKERRAGTAIFIPIDSVVIDAINLNYLRSLDESARPAIDVVKYDDTSIERAVQFVFGDTLIVDDIDVARELKWESNHNLESKLVSLDGSVIHKSGLMTGGQQQKKSMGLAWSKQEWNRLTKRKDELTAELSKVRTERPNPIDINNLTEEISQIDEELPVVRSKIANLERKVSERNAEINFYGTAHNEIEESIKRKQNELNELEAKVAENLSKVESLQEKVYAEFCSTYNLASIADYEFLHGPALRARARERSEFHRSISALKSQLSFQKERLDETLQRVEKLEGDLNRLEAEYETVSDAVAVGANTLESLETELHELKAQEENQKSLLSQKLNEANSKQSDIKDAESEIRSLSKELVNSEELITRVDTERLNMLKNCKIENVDLPLEDGFLESISLGDDTLDVSSVVYQIHLDYGLLDVRYQDHYSAKTEAELSVKIENVEKELQLLAPNAKAMERLKDVDQKLKEFDREFNKARQDEKKTAARFNEVKELRTELFMKAFTHISDRIDGIYKELTKSSTAPLGGSAYLTLEDEEEPYAAGIRYHAMPPMKRFKDMELLSGGEKTMAALALLFAIHSYQPSPFFVLDEIDAALDNTNVQKIANYIKQHAGPGFQFIVISLKSTLFENSDALVGIYREQRENSSRTMTLDLREYSDVPQEVPLQTEATAATA